MSKDLDPDKDKHCVGPDLGPNCLQRLSADNKSCHQQAKKKKLLFKETINVFLWNIPNFKLYTGILRVCPEKNQISLHICPAYMPYKAIKCIWVVTWDSQQCGMCNQQSLRSACAYAQSDQSLWPSLEYSMSVKLMTEHHLEFLSLKGGCTGSSESTPVKMPHCWKSHVAAHLASFMPTVNTADSQASR